MSEREQLAVLIHVARSTWVGGGDNDFDLHLADAVLAYLKQTREDTFQKVMNEHNNQMRLLMGYPILEDKDD